MVANMTKENAEQRIEELKTIVDNATNEMVTLALNHNINLYLNGFGSLLLEDDHWTGKGRGEWYTSTDSCN